MQLVVTKQEKITINNKIYNMVGRLTIKIICDVKIEKLKIKIFNVIFCIFLIKDLLIDINKNALWKEQILIVRMWHGFLKIFLMEYIG